MGTNKTGAYKLCILCRLWAVILLFAWNMNTEALAAGTISSVGLNVSHEMKVGEETSGETIEIKTDSNRYVVEDIQILNEQLVWGPLDIPVIQVTLQAESQYKFAVKTSDIRVKGAEYIRGSRTEASDCLFLILRLPSMSGQVGEIGWVKWTSETVGAWEEPFNAGSYDVYLYRDGKSAGSWKNIQGNTLDFGAKMGKAGVYSFKVRAVNTRDDQVKSQWVEAQSTNVIDGQQAEQLRGQYGLQLPEGIDGPGEVAAYLAQQNVRDGWNQDHIGWWYRNADGSYTTSGWQLIDGQWYYFDSVGYMVTGWIDWNEKSYYCDPVTGAMLADTVVPDGSGRRVDDSGAWIH